MTENRELSLSIEEMLKLAEQVKDWRATRVFSYQEKESRYINLPKPQASEFQGRIEGVALEVESSASNSFSRWYRITASTPLNILGHYKEKERKCSPRLIELFSDLESKYIQKVKSDMEDGLDKARRLVGDK